MGIETELFFCLLHDRCKHTDSAVGDACNAASLTSAWAVDKKTSLCYI